MALGNVQNSFLHFVPFLILNDPVVFLEGRIRCWSDLECGFPEMRVFNIFD
jgi:hypothetical protein